MATKSKKQATSSKKSVKKPALSKTEIAIEVQAETGYSLSHITKVLGGFRTNEQITKAAKNVVKKQQVIFTN